MSIRQAAAEAAVGVFIWERMAARALTVEDLAAASGIPKTALRRNLSDPGQWSLADLSRASEGMGEHCLPFTVAALEVYTAACA